MSSQSIVRTIDGPAEIERNANHVIIYTPFELSWYLSPDEARDLAKSLNAAADDD